MVLPDVIAFDSETTISQTYRRSYVLCADRYRENNYIVDFQQLGGEITFDEVAPFLEGKTLVGHNLTFDLGWLYKYNFIPKKFTTHLLQVKYFYNGNGLITTRFWFCDGA